MIILSGVRPTGSLHLGNYLGAINQWVKMQDSQENKDSENLFCIVDLHALTTTKENIASDTKTIAAAYLACGIKPDKSSVFVQSHVPEHTELAWFLSCFAPMGWLNRMTQFKEKAGKNKEKANLGLYSYPVLMAADILIYNSTHVPVGEDQKQHLELARDLAQLVNNKYENEIFTIPEPLILKNQSARVMSLRDGTKKMSKSDLSDYSRIHLSDDAETISMKIKKAKSDSEMLPVSIEEMEKRPEAKNFMTLYAELSNTSINNVINEFGGNTFSPLKNALSDVLVEKIVPIGNEMKKLLNNEDYLFDVLKNGRENARNHAKKTISKIKISLGLLEL